MFDAPPEAFGSYRVLEELRTGRFGPIYRGRDETTGLAVAIKIIDRPLEPEQAEVLAAAIARLADAPLQHPSIVPVLSAGVAGQRVWVAEPWFGAPALDGLMRRHSAQPVADVVLRVTQLAAALDFAAAVGLYHGALHPRDMLAADDRVVVSGVGVVQAFAEAALAVPLTGAYISPQRKNGLPPTAADDVFALAWITYELICGATLPTGSDLRSGMPAVAGVDRAAFAGVLERALAQDADARPSSALAFAESLQAIVVAPVDEPEPAVATSHEPGTPIWDADPDDDIPIHRPSPAIDVEPAHEPVIREQALQPRAPRSDPAPAPDYGYWFPVSATLAVGLLMGFASGYVVGQRERIPEPYSAERAVTRNEGRQSKPPAAPEAPPAASSGRAYTDSIVPPEGSAGEAAAPPPSAPAPAETPAEAEPPTAAVNPSAPGVLQVESRPRGARVFLDGRLVGTTPVVVQDVRPGSHAVRIDLVGHRRWVTTVDLAPGARQRVAASLER